MRCLGIIPARGGSKGIPRKNLFPLHGRPLLAYTIDAARASRYLGRCIVSSDDAEIIDLARSLGAEVPFVRPADLAHDDAGSAAVVRHALQMVEELECATYDAAVLLEPTAPLRIGQDIDAAIERLASTGAQSVVTVCQVEAPHPMKMQTIVGNRLRPFLPEHWREGRTRQELPDVYYLNGAVYAVRSAVIRNSGSLWGTDTAPLVMPPERSVNIDSMIDVALADYLLGTQR